MAFKIFKKNMKKTLILLFVLLPFSLVINAQGNLEYNKVKLVTINGSSPDIVITVPVGKVWKIESAIVGSYIYGSPNIYLDYQIIYQPGLVNKIFPIWLPSGSYTLSISCASCYGSNGPSVLKGSISAIKYNEVP